jgi:hypothetical protein
MTWFVPFRAAQAITKNEDMYPNLYLASTKTEQSGYHLMRNTTPIPIRRSMREAPSDLFVQPTQCKSNVISSLLRRIGHIRVLNFSPRHYCGFLLACDGGGGFEGHSCTQVVGGMGALVVIIQDRSCVDYNLGQFAVLVRWRANQPVRHFEKNRLGGLQEIERKLITSIREVQLLDLWLPKDNTRLRIFVVFIPYSMMKRTCNIKKEKLQ